MNMSKSPRYLAVLYNIDLIFEIFIKGIGR